MRPLRPSLLAAALLLAIPAAVACNTYADALARGQRAFEANEHDRALAILRGLEPDVSRLSLYDRAHYEYLRGMTDYRIGYKAEARHWLALAVATDKTTPGALPENWARRAADSLKDLNDSVYKNGITSLTNTPSALPSNAEEDEDASAP